MICTHLGKSIGTIHTGFGDEPQFQCGHRQHQSCTAAECLVCGDFFPQDVSPAVAANARTDRPRHPTGVCVDRYDHEAGIADLFLGAHCFLILGGPSLKKMPLELLSRRGVLIMSINNCPAALPAGVRPHIWTHTDPPGKFLDSIWRDPAILKFAPCRTWGKSSPDTKKRDGIFTRDPDTGKIVHIPGVRCRDMPGIIGYHRNTGFDPAKWLFEPTINRGNDKKSATGQDKHGNQVQPPNGWPRVINTMLTAVRLAFYLGIENLYLLGADFGMSKGSIYAFDEKKSEGGIGGNNWAYTKMCAMFDDLRPRFEAAGFFVHNCTPDSELWSFDHLPFEEAIQRATEGLEQEMSPHGWYTKD